MFGNYFRPKFVCLKIGGGFVIFHQGATFSDFIDLGILNYIPLDIQISISLFWGIFSVRFKPHQVVVVK